MQLISFLSWFRIFLEWLYHVHQELITRRQRPRSESELFYLSVSVDWFDLCGDSSLPGPDSIGRGEHANPNGNKAATDAWAEAVREELMGDGVRCLASVWRRVRQALLA